MDCGKDVYEPIASWFAHHLVDMRKLTSETLSISENLKVMNLLHKIKHCWIVNIGVAKFRITDIDAAVVAFNKLHPILSHAITSGHFPYLTKPKPQRPPRICQTSTVPG